MFATSVVLYFVFIPVFFSFVHLIFIQCSERMLFCGYQLHSYVSLERCVLLQEQLYVGFD